MDEFGNIINSVPLYDGDIKALSAKIRKELDLDSGTPIKKAFEKHFNVTIKYTPFFDLPDDLDTDFELIIVGKTVTSANLIGPGRKNGHDEKDIAKFIGHYYMYALPNYDSDDTIYAVPRAAGDDKTKQTAEFAFNLLMPEHVVKKFTDYKQAAEFYGMAELFVKAHFRNLGLK